MEEKKLKFLHRIRYRNSVVPISRKFNHFDVELKKRHRITVYMNEIAERARVKERGAKVGPLLPSTSSDNDIQDFCRNCPSTSMSRFQEKDIIRRINARGLEEKHPILFKNIIKETREEFINITHEAGVKMKIKTSKFVLQPYRHLGRSDNYNHYLKMKQILKKKFILHLPLIRKILEECASLSYDVDLNQLLGNPLEVEEFQRLILEVAKNLGLYLQEFYEKILGLVEKNESSQTSLEACTGLLSVNVSKTIAHTLLHAVSFTGSKEHAPYLKLNITFNDRLILRPTADDIINIYERFLKKIIHTANQFNVLEKNRVKGKTLNLCLTEEFFYSVMNQITTNIKEKYEPILLHVENLENEFSDIYNPSILINDLIFDDACLQIEHFKSYLPKIAHISDNVYFRLGQLVLIGYRESLKEVLLSIIGSIFNSLKAQHEWENNDICEAFNIVNVRATQKPVTTEEVIETGKYVTWFRNEFYDELKERVVTSVGNLSKLIQLGELSEDHLTLNARAINFLDDILPVLEENSSNFEQLKFEAEEKLQKIIEEVNVDIKNISPLLEMLDSMDDILNVRNSLNVITLHLVKIREIESKINWINQEEVALSFPKSSYLEFLELKNYIYPFHHLLKMCLKVQRNLSVWLDGQFDKIIYESTQQTVDELLQELLNIQKIYRNKLKQAQDDNLALRFKGTVDDPDMLNWPAPLKLSSKAIKLIQDFQPSLAVIKIMCNEALMGRHWEKMSKVAGFDIQPDAGTTLRKIMQIDLKPNLDKYELISVAANKEKQLLESLNLMKNEWSLVNFSIEELQEIRIITKLEDLEIMAEDHAIRVVKMLNSVFVKPYYEPVLKFYQKLLGISRIVQEFQDVQSHILKLLPLFSKISTDESCNFQEVFAVYNNWIEKISAKPTVQDIVTTDILLQLSICNQKCEVVHKGVENYFHQVSRQFPRFYFLQQEQVFHILSSSNPAENINCIFNNIIDLEIDATNILSVIGKNNEIIKLELSIPLTSPEYLISLESQLKSTIKNMINEALEEFDIATRIEKWCYQINLITTRIIFTAKVQESFKKLADYLQEIENNFKILLELKDTSNSCRKKIISLLVSLINDKNTVENLIAEKVSNEDDFKWLLHLRYYLMEEIYVKILNDSFKYGYEYFGPNHFVTTPVSEINFCRLLMSSNALITGVGKSETVKFLASCLGIYCKFFSCVQGVKFEIFQNFLKGSILSGFWLCLEDFERVEVETVSLLAQKLFNSVNMLPRPLLCFVAKPARNFPENFKSLCRPVVITEVESCIIAEVTLLSNGFKNSKILARKVITVHELFREFLVFDFGINTVKKVLEVATNFTELSEEDAIIRSIRLVHSSKLPEEYLGLFNKVLVDIFPNQMMSLENRLSIICRDLNLRPTEKFINKVHQVHELMKYRTGVALVGKAMTGKTTLINVLEASLDHEICKKIISPKALTLEQLYGRFINKTSWADGLITQCLRKGGNTFWVVLDGPIDSSWVDDLNTAMDDEPKLCLSSGETVCFENKSFLFEVDDLCRVSPATISRCGVIYIDQNTIGWQPLVETWISKNPGLVKGYEDQLLSLFNWIIPPSVQFTEANCVQLCKIKETVMVKTLLSLFGMFLENASVGITKKEEDAKNICAWLQASFIQAVMWGIGGVLDSTSLVKFDDFFKQLWKGQNETYPLPPTVEKIEVTTPSEGLITDSTYIYKNKGNWKYWPDTLKNEKIEPCLYLSETLIPTAESVKFTSLINMHVIHNISLLIAGPRAGKTLCIEDYINKLNRKKFEHATIHFTKKIKTKQIQELVLSKLTKKSRNFAASEGKTFVLFLDDLHLPQKDNFDSEPIKELVRQFLEQRQWYDLNSTKSMAIDSVNILAAMQARNKVCQRFSRHFNVFCINDLQEESIVRIYSNVMFTRLRLVGFGSDIMATCNQIAAATYRLYQCVTELKPSPSWRYYCFGLRNSSRVIQACSMINKENADKKLFFRLWFHESLRAFGDRLLPKDQEWFLTSLKAELEETNCEDLSDLCFGTYGNNIFEESDYEKLKGIASGFVKNKRLILFDYAVKHLSRISRVLSLPSASLLQIGLSGCGRKTLTNLACLMHKQKFFVLKDLGNWRQEFKSVLIEAGGFGPCVLFLREEFLQEEMLEDIDFFLSNGSLPYAPLLEEQQKVLEVVRNSVPENFRADANSIFLYYRRRCKENLHLILSFDVNTSSVKKYSSILKYCEVDIFENWPKEAIEAVAKSWIEVLEIPNEIKSQIASCFSYFHYSLENLDKVITIGSFLECVNLYVDLVKIKQESITETKRKYLSALEKLAYAAFQISEMQKSLADYQPQLEEMTKRAIDMAKEIETETIEVEIASDLVRKDEKIANEQAAAAQILKLDCEADLAQAIPILEDAISALNTLKPTDITLVKSMKNPPDAIKLVMAAVCVMKEVKPDKIPDPSTGRKTLDYWGPSKRILGDMNFLQTLKDFDKDNIKAEVIAKIRKDYLPHKDFKPNVVAKASSAAEGLCKWIIAMDMYDKVAKEVAPKKDKLEKAEKEYGNTIIILNEKKEQVRRIEQRLADLNTLLKDAIIKQERLQFKVDTCKRKLSRAQKLIEGLSEERIRWTSAVSSLDDDYKSLPGDILLASGTVAYLGQFYKNQREIFLESWCKYVREIDVPVSEEYNFPKIFSKEFDFDEWFLTAEFFLQNAVISRLSKRRPLFIDPQKQANKWIRSVEKFNGIKITNINAKNFTEILEECLSFGYPLLIENVEAVQPFCEKLLFKDILNKNFVLYITTNLKHPKYPTFVSDKFKIIDFKLTEEGLEENFLTLVVEVEKPSLKKLRKSLTAEKKTARDALRNIETKILTTLAESTTDILEDEMALEILDKTKISFREIEGKQFQLIESQNSLEAFKINYIPLAKRSRILYFSLFQLSEINHMYQFSLDWFTAVYFESIQKAHRYKDLTRRIESLIQTLTIEVFDRICRSIFEEHKLFFAFLVCINCEGKIENFGENKYQEFFQKNSDKFEQIIASKVPETEIFPPPYNSKFDIVQIISIIRPDRFFKAVEIFVISILGEQFTTPPKFDMKISFQETHILSPIIFILKENARPVTDFLLQLAKIKHMDEKLRFFSVTNIDFDEILKSARELGLWVCLQNCELNTTFLGKLDVILEEIDYDNTQDSFRLWLTTNECQNFPVSLLERSIKIVKDSPRGVRNIVQDFFTTEPIKSKDFFNSCPDKHETFSRLIYSLSIFHAILMERKNFNNFGINIPYELNENDFYFSIYKLQSIINRSCNIEELICLVGKCIYGHYITDKFNNKLLSTILLDCINKVNYGFPIKSDYQDYIQHIGNFDDSYNFGISPNYDIVRELKFSSPLIKSIRNIYSYKEPVGASVCFDIIDSLPQNISIQSPDMVIENEVKHYNRLLKKIRKTIIDYEDDEDMYCSITKNEIPQQWLKKSYPSKLSLSEFLVELKKRVEYFQNLHKTAIIWLGAFFNPKAYLMAKKIEVYKDHGLIFNEIKLKFSGNSGKGDTLIDGLFMIGAGWNKNEARLEELLPGVIQTELPTLLLNLIWNAHDENFDCPFYNVFGDVGPDNLLASVIVPHRGSDDSWVRRNVAIFCRMS